MNRNSYMCCVVVYLGRPQNKQIVRKGDSLFEPNKNRDSDTAK